MNQNFKKSSGLISTLLVFAMILGTVTPGFAQTFGDGAEYDSTSYEEGNDVEVLSNVVTSTVTTPGALGYTFVNKEITGYTGTETEIVIPDAFLVGEDVIEVEGVGYRAFRNNAAIKSVTMGSNINYVGEAAFQGCKALENVVLGKNTAELGKNAFQNCTKLKTIDLNNKLETIGETAFGASGLVNVILGENTETLGKNAFINNYSLKSITLNDKLETIGASAFSGCSVLKKVILGKGIKTLGDNAFAGCTEVETISLNEGLEVIGKSAFGSTKITEITIPGTVKTIGESPFAGCVNLTKIVLEKGKPGVETTIGKSAFSGIAIIEITIPGNVKTIGESAFKDCTSLKDVTLEEGIETISKNVFLGTAITEINIPGSVKTIGAMAFGNCVLLKDVTLKEGLKEIQNNVFGNTIIEEITIPSTIEIIGANVFANNSVLKKIIILKEENDESLNIATNAFPDGVTIEYKGSPAEKPEYTFDVDKKEITKYTGTGTEIVIPDTFLVGENVVYVERIGTGAFSDNKTIEKVTIPASVKIIGEQAFSECTSLKHVILTDGLEEIHSQAFAGTAIEEITIPSTIEKIEVDIFANNGLLKKIIILKEEENIDIAAGAFPEGVIVEYKESTEEIKTPEELGYKFNAAKNEITKYMGTDKEIVIPKAFLVGGEAVEVKYIGEKAFVGSAIEKVHIPGNIKTIGKEAFQSVKTLIEVTLEDGLENIETGAFQYINITEITIPGSVKKIGEYAFNFCSKLNELTFEEGMLEEIGSNAFYSTKITEITIPRSVKKIGGAGFFNCSDLNKVTLNEGLEEIGDDAFSNTAIREIVLPKSIKNLGKAVFSGCTSLKRVTLNEGLTSISNGLFKSTAVEEVNIPESIKSIGTNAFYNNKSIKEINIPGNVKTIGQFAFSECESLSIVTLNEGLQEIQMNAFEKTQIEKIDIPSTIKKIGMNIFKDNNVIIDIFIGNSKENIIEKGGSIESDAFPSYATVRYADVPKEEVKTPQELGYGFDKEKKKITGYSGTAAEITIPLKLKVNGEIIDVEVIGEGAFKDSQTIKEVSVHKGIRSIEKNAFYNCGSLIEVELEEGLKEIGEGVFQLTGIKKINVPTSVESIGSKAFKGCSSLDEINLNAVNVKLKSIGEEAFAQAESITKITIPNSVETIGKGAFQDCTKLNEVTLGNILAEIESMAFYNTAIEKISISGNIKAIGDGAFGQCVKLSEAKFNRGLKTIGKGAFQNTVLKEIKIPRSVRTIDENAFAGCTGLNEVSIEEGLEELSAGAFSKTSIKELVIPSTIRIIGSVIFTDNSVLEKITVMNKKENITVADDAFPSGIEVKYEEPVVSEEGENVIEDPVLKKLINKSLNKDNLDSAVTVEILKGITRINKSGTDTEIYGDELWEMKSLEGLQYAENLQFLGLPGAQIVDLSPIKDLKNITEITILGGYEGNNKDLLEEKTPLKDIGILGEMEKLKSIIISGTQLEDVTPIANLKNLTYLSLTYNEISNIGCLKDVPIPDTGQLILSGNRISDFSPLNGKRPLKPSGSQRITIVAESLILDNPLINAAGGYEVLKENEYVVNEGSNKEKIKVVKIPADESITIEYGDYGSKLTIIFSDMNVIKDTILKKAVNLYRNAELKEKRSVNQTVAKEDLEDLKEFNLSYISEDDRKLIKDIAGLENLKNATILSLKGTGVKDLAPISNLTKLESIFLGGTYTDNGLANEYLKYNNTKWRSPLKDISPLAGLVNLKEIWINDSEVEDVSHLKDLKNISSAYLMRNKIKEVHSLKDMPVAYNLFLQGNCISDFSSMKGKSALKLYIGQSVSVAPDKVEFDNPLKSIDGNYVKLPANEYIVNTGDKGEKLKVLKVPAGGSISTMYGSTDEQHTLLIDVSLIRAEFGKQQVSFKVMKTDGRTIDNAKIQVWNAKKEEVLNAGTAPYVWSLADGSYTYKASLEGYVVKEGSFEVKGAALTVEVKMNPVETDNPGGGTGGGAPLPEEVITEPKPEEIPANLKSEKEIKLEKGSIKISPDTFEGKTMLTAKEESSYLELTAVDEKGNKAEVKKPLFVEIKYDGQVKNPDNVTVVFTDENGREELVGGVYDANTGTVKFITNKLGKFTVREGSKEFSDTSGVEWAETAIEALAVKGIMNGKSADMFAPSDNITRAEFAALISRMMKLNENAAAGISFGDVTEDKWYYGSVAAVYAEGLINGKSGEAFDPEGNITRQEMARIVGALLRRNPDNVQAAGKAVEFKDADLIADWAKGSVEDAVNSGVIVGIDGSFMPDKNATRAEAAVMLYRLYSLFMNR